MGHYFLDTQYRYSVMATESLQLILILHYNTIENINIILTLE